MSNKESMRVILARMEERQKHMIKNQESLRSDYDDHEKSLDAHGLGGAKWMFRLILTLIGLSIAGVGLIVKVAAG